MPNNRQFRDTQIGLANYKRSINLIFGKLKLENGKEEGRNVGLEMGRWRANLRLRTYLLNGVKH